MAWFECYATITKEGKIESKHIDVILEQFAGKQVVLKIDDKEN